MTQDKVDNRAKLLEAVDQLLLEREPSAISLREVARRAGVSHALPGVLFGDRRAMLTAVAAAGFRGLGEAMGAALAGAEDGGAALAATGRAYVDFALANPARFELMFGRDHVDLADPAYLQACRDGFVPLAEAMRRLAVERGLSRQDARDVGAIAWAMAHGLCTLWMSGHLPAREGLARHEELVERLTGLLAERLPRAR